MTHLHIIRAWKDPEYRLSLSQAERAQLPAHPAGLIELAEADLAGVAGGESCVSKYIRRINECNKAFETWTSMREGCIAEVNVLDECCVDGPGPRPSKCTIS